MGLDFDKIKQAAEGYRADMTAFLRAMISHPSESCEEKEVVACIKAEMEKLNFDKVEVDGLGNVIGWMGEGDKIIAIATSTTGKQIRTRATRLTRSSTAAAVPTRKAVWQVLFTAQRS